MVDAGEPDGVVLVGGQFERADASRRELGDRIELGQIIVGSPDTVYDKLWPFIRDAHIGNMLIQFHIGNLNKELTIKSQRLFAEKVLPVLQRDKAFQGEVEPAPLAADPEAERLFAPA